MTERALAQDVTPSPATVKPRLLVLSQLEFDDSVRQALRDLRRPDLLSRNPLLRTRLLRDRAGDEEPGAATLEAVVGAAVEHLGEHPRDDKLWRAVERTYVRPAATQERAAATADPAPQHLGRGDTAPLGRGRQDEASRAWNLHIALCYKAGGVPWRRGQPLGCGLRPPSDLRLSTQHRIINGGRPRPLDGAGQPGHDLRLEYKTIMTWW